MSSIEVTERSGYTVGGVSFDWLGSVVTTKTGPICGYCGHHHANAAAILACHQVGWGQEEDMRAEMAAEHGYERHLEDRGYEDARADEQHYLSMGVMA